MAARPTRPPFIELLVALAAGRPLALSRELSLGEVDWFVRVGCAPILWHAAGHVMPGKGVAQGLQAAELTARVLHHQTLAQVETLAGQLAAQGIVPTLLKGISYATRYYPEPHLRIMGDVDLLIDGADLPRAQSILTEDGFKARPAFAVEDYDRHHHAPPLHHREKQLWVELHRSLLPPDYLGAAEPPFTAESLPAEQEPGKLGAQPVRRLSRECELVYLASGWCHDLSIGAQLASPGPQRQLVDAVLLISASGDALDWERVLGWCRGSQTGVCLYLMLSYLARHGVFPDGDLLARLRQTQAFITPGVARSVHRLFDRYLLEPAPPGRLVTPNIAAGLLATLMRPRPAWRNRLQVPLDMLFPPGAARRYQLGYQLDRLASLFKAR